MSRAAAKRKFEAEEVERSIESTLQSQPPGHPRELLPALRRIAELEDELTAAQAALQETRRIQNRQARDLELHRIELKAQKALFSATVGYLQSKIDGLEEDNANLRNTITDESAANLENSDLKEYIKDLEEEIDYLKDDAREFVLDKLGLCFSIPEELLPAMA